MIEKQIERIYKALARIETYIAAKAPPANMYTLVDTATKLGVTPTMLRRDITANRIDSPIHNKGSSRKYYDDADLENLRKYYQDRPPVVDRLEVHAERRRAGFYSLPDVAQMCNVAPIVIQHHIKQGRIQKPTLTWKHLAGLYYSGKEARAIKLIMSKREGFMNTGRRGPRV